MNNKNDKIFSLTETKSQQVQKRRIDEATADIIQIMAVSKRRFDSPSNLEKPFIDDWLSMFENMPESLQIDALNALIPHCTQNQIKHLQSVIEPYLQIDFLSFLPKELSLKIINYLSPSDLALSASGVSRFWRSLAEDKLLWAEKCRQNSISEMFPPNICFAENWSSNDPGTENCSKFTVNDLRHQNGRSLLKSVAFPPARSNSLPTCFERSRWKAIYLRNLRISNNWRLRRPTAVCQLRGHDEHVITCLKLRGDLIVTGSDDCTLRVWSATTGTCVHILNGHIGGVWALQLSQDGEIASTVRCMSLRKNILVTGSRDCSIKIWDIVEGKCIRTLYGHLAAVRCVKFDGFLIVSGAYDNNIHVWNAADGSLAHVLEGHTDRVYSLHFVSYRKLLISGSLDTTIRVWKVDTGECMQTLVGHQSLTSGMKLRENILVSANADSTIKVWNILDGTCVHTFAGPNKHVSAVTGLRFLRNGMVATSGDDGFVKLWDVKEGTFVCDLLRLTSRGVGGCVWRMKATPTLLICAVGSRNGTEDTKLVLMDFDSPYP
uniref:F-box domain-containing protein n=1 Tax=Globodera rostochiensis TaxID=31243 RepID=A0A914HKE5_GLORO